MVLEFISADGKKSYSRDCYIPLGTGTGEEGYNNREFLIRYEVSQFLPHFRSLFGRRPFNIFMRAQSKMNLILDEVLEDINLGIPSGSDVNSD